MKGCSVAIVFYMADVYVSLEVLILLLIDSMCGNKSPKGVVNVFIKSNDIDLLKSEGR